MRKLLFRIVCVTLVVFFVGAYATRAQVISFNFATDNGNALAPSNPIAPTEFAGAPGYSVTNWNNLFADYYAVAGAMPTSILSSLGGTVTGLTLVYDAPNCWHNTSTNTATGDDKLMKNYLDSGANDSPYVVLSGVPYRKFDVVFYVDGDQPANGCDGPYVVRYGNSTQAAAQSEAALNRANLLRPIAWLKEPGMFSGTYYPLDYSNSLSVAAARTGNYFVVRGLKGNITLDPTQTTGAGTVRAPLNGFQIVPWTYTNAIPEADDALATVVLAGGPATTSVTRTVGSMTTSAGVYGDLFIDPGVTLTLANGDLDIGDINHWIKGGGSIMSGTGTLTINRDISAGLGYASGATDASINGVTLVDNGATPLNVVKTGGGKLRMQTANPYTGTTLISQGTIEIGNTGALGNASSAVTLGDSQTSYFDTGLYLRSGVSFSRDITVTSAGASAMNMLLGSIEAGTQTFSGTITLNRKTEFTATTNSSLTMAGTITGAGVLSKSGAGTVTLTGTNTYTGGTIVNAGGPLVVDLIADSGISRLGTAGGSSNYLAIAGGTLQFTGTGTYATTRYLWIDQGTGTFDITDTNGVLVLAPAGGTVNKAVTKTGAGQLVLGAVVSAGGSVRVNSGILALTGANTYTGGTTIANSVLQVGTNGASGTLGIGVVTNNGLLVFNRSNLWTADNLITGTGMVVHAGSGGTTLTATNTYTGRTIVSNGYLRIGNPQQLGAAPATYTADQVVLDGGALQTSATLTWNEATRGLAVGASGGTLAPDAGTTLSLVSPLSGNGPLTLAGTGKLCFDGEHPYAGAITAAVGTVWGSGSVSNASLTVRYGATAGAASGSDSGHLTVGSLTLESGARVRCPSGTTNAIFRVNGPLTTAATNWVDIPLITNVLANGTTVLIDYDTLGGAGFEAFRLSHTFSRSAVTLVNNTNDTTVDLVVSGALGATNLLWQGAAGGLWDVDVTTNWTLSPGGLTTTFMNQDQVLFNDSAATGLVTLAETVYPASIVVSNNALPYRLGGQPVAGSCSLLKQGTGTLTIAQDQTFTGGVTVAGGVLLLQDAVNDQTGVVRGTLTISDGGIVKLGTANALGYGAGIHVDTVNIYEGSRLENTVGGDNGWWIAINLRGGELRSNGGVSAPGGQYFSLGGPAGGSGSSIHSIAAAAPSVISGRLNLRENNSGNQLPFNVEDGAAVTDLLVTAAITEAAAGYGISKTGPGTMVIAGNCTYSNGATTVNQGVLKVSAAEGGHLYNAGYTTAILTLNSGTTLEVDRYEYGVNNSLGQLRNNYTALLVNGARLRIVGTDAANTGYRAFTIGAGGATLDVPAGTVFHKLAGTTAGLNTIRNTGNYSLTLSGDGTGQIDDNLGMEGTWTSAALAKVGAGSWTLTGTNTYGGATSINGGTLVLNGSITNSSVTVAAGATLGGTGVVAGAVSNAGTVSPGASPGVLSAGSYDQQTGGTLKVEIGGTDPGTGYDRLQVSGTANLAGTLNASALGGFQPMMGQQFTVLTAATVSGTFSDITGTPGSGRTWTVTYLPGEVRLGVRTAGGGILLVK